MSYETRLKILQQELVCCLLLVRKGHVSKEPRLDKQTCSHDEFLLSVIRLMCGRLDVDTTRCEEMRKEMGDSIIDTDGSGKGRYKLIAKLHGCCDEVFNTFVHAVEEGEEGTCVWSAMAMVHLLVCPSSLSQMKGAMGMVEGMAEGGSTNVLFMGLLGFVQLLGKVSYEEVLSVRLSPPVAKETDMRSWSACMMLASSVLTVTGGDRDGPLQFLRCILMNSKKILLLTREGDDKVRVNPVFLGCERAFDVWPVSRSFSGPLPMRFGCAAPSPSSGSLRTLRQDTGSST